MSITKRHYGILPDGQEVSLFTLTNNNGLSAEIIDYGGIIVTLNVPDRNGKISDIVLGYDNLEDYLKQTFYLGAIIGRHANRIGGASLALEGRVYELAKNDGKNHLHGGENGFDKKVWEARIINSDGDEGLELSLFSPDGEEHYPGNLKVRVIYRLTDADALEIEYFGISDRKTVLNMTNHSYFNLAGHDQGPVTDHQLKINADFYTPIDSGTLPTGEIINVQNTPFDFTSFKNIGDGLINHADNEQIKLANGYDHNFVLRKSDDNILEEACNVYEPSSGRFMKVFTTKPGVQLYSGNYLVNSIPGKGGAQYGKWHGFCLETQYFPNALTHRHFPSPILKVGEKYYHKTVYQFSVK
ncbi:MAG: galactose mutarotase [Clostridiaceae bacterium]|nr:galactose mutarotase [Clostridiaceae bacterium]